MSFEIRKGYQSVIFGKIDKIIGVFTIKYICATQKLVNFVVVVQFSRFELSYTCNFFTKLELFSCN